MMDAWARVLDGVVVEPVQTVDPAGRYHPSMVWVECSAYPDVAPGWTYDDGVFAPPSPALPTVAAAQAARIASLSAACEAAIVAGYSSAALGAVHTYPSDRDNQNNMTVSVVASLLPSATGDTGWTTPFLCADVSGTWAMRWHTAAQIQQAGEDGKAAIQALRVRYATLSAEVMAAADVGAVNAIVW